MIIFVKEGYDNDYGARPLKRLIQREIQDNVALGLLSGEFKEEQKLALTLDKKRESLVIKVD